MLKSDHLRLKPRTNVNFVDLHQRLKKKLKIIKKKLKTFDLHQRLGKYLRLTETQVVIAEAEVWRGYIAD